tara:strand:+ start:753 stop:1493 length:741 start_codon:yes stop_codon:yes gene_type:complete
MKKTKINLDSNLLKEIDLSRLNVKQKFNLDVSNAIHLVISKILEKHDEGCYVEAGVFQGAMILNIAEFLKTKKISMKLYGVDTFEGFPENTLTSKYDHPIYFNNLFEDGLISEEHFLKAKERTNGFKLKEHLTTHYFNHTEGLFENSKNYENVNLLKTEFCNINNKFNEEIAVLFIDCDLYPSYMDVLNQLFNKVIEGGVIIFDEYYSLKYPGALKAVHDFFIDKSGKLEYCVTEEGFDRVYFIKH